MNPMNFRASIAALLLCLLGLPGRAQETDQSSPGTNAVATTTSETPVTASASVGA